VQNKRFWSETYNRFLKFRMVADVIKKVKLLPHGIDDYIMKTSRVLLRYPAAIQMQKNLTAIHEKRAVNVHPTETNAKGINTYLPLDMWIRKGTVGGPGGSIDKREKAEKAERAAVEAAAVEAAAKSDGWAAQQG